MVDGMTGQLEEQQKAQPGFVVHGEIEGPLIENLEAISPAASSQPLRS